MALGNSNKDFGLGLLFVLLSTIFLQTSPVSANSGADRVAVLDLINSTDGNLPDREIQYISELVRGATRKSLSVERFLIMTRENIIALLPPDRAISDCLGECAVETGRKLDAQYVVTGEVMHIGGELRVLLILHETDSGNLLRQERVGGNSILSLEETLEEEVAVLLQPLGPSVRSNFSGGEISLGGGSSAWQAGEINLSVVNFESTPPGATVEVDGVPLCVTPCSQPLPIGKAEVSFKLLRYLPSTRVVDVVADMSPVSDTLTPNFGWLSVTSNPSGLNLEVDGESVGVTPVQRMEIGIGAHDVWIRHPFHIDEGKRVVVAHGEHETFHLQPVPINGGLLVEARDRNGNALQGRVFVDGVYAGLAWSSLTVQAGPRDVEFRGDEGEWREKITIPAEDLLVVEAEVDGDNIGMVRIPAGTFLMGSPGTALDRDKDELQHQVTLSHDFLISATEVTQAQYQSVMGINPGFFKGEKRPVETVSWFDAVKFCNRLSKKEGFQPAYSINEENVTWNHGSNGYRLPTEAEWEYACRAGATSRFNLGDGESDLSRAGWHLGNSDGKTHDAGEKTPNEWGLYDMHGNVSEWCWDWYGAYSGGHESDPEGPGPGAYRVVRGGYWSSYARRCRSARRYYFYPYNSVSSIGFRPVRSVF